MRAIALIAAYNERRFMDACMAHLERQGIDAYLIDNGSTDNTVEIAEAWLHRNLTGIESFPRGEGDTYDWRGLLRRKEELAGELDADWFIHQDPDEVRLPPAADETLRSALEAADSENFNAVDFAEFTFMPTREEPDHDHPQFQRTLRTYYSFDPSPPPRRLTAWKAHTNAKLESGGHRVDFPGVRIFPRRFRMKHYLFLSKWHAIEKYVERRYSSVEIEGGWHGWRARLSEEDIRLPSRSELLVSLSDDDLNQREPRSTHYLDNPAKRPHGARSGFR